MNTNKRVPSVRRNVPQNGNVRQPTANECAARVQADMRDRWSRAIRATGPNRNS